MAFFGSTMKKLSQVYARTLAKQRHRFAEMNVAVLFPAAIGIMVIAKTDSPWWYLLSIPLIALSLVSIPIAIRGSYEHLKRYDRYYDLHTKKSLGPEYANSESATKASRREKQQETTPDAEGKDAT
jgi:hypothetical protein